MTTATTLIEYPSEILSRICSHIYSACLPALPSQSSLDPLFVSEVNYGVPTSLPSSLPQSHWSEQASRQTLATLCLVNHAWYEAAKPWLWKKLEVRLPRTWLSLVDEIAWNHEEETVDRVMEQTVKAAAMAAAMTRQLGNMADKEEAQRLEECILDSIAIPHEEANPPDDAIPFELLSPMASREPSPRRYRPKSKSPARWELVRSISNALQNVLERREPGVYVPTPHDPSPGRFVQHLDFNHFRTIGMRRSVDEGVNSRFVTGDRVEAVLKEMPNLTAFGATEYMDGALTLPVLKELFLRGFPSRGRGRPARGRALVDLDDAEEDDRDRRRQCRELEAIDFTGCVSAVFVNALTEFVTAHLLPPVESDWGRGDDAQRELRRLSLEEPLIFPGMQRLGLRGVKSVLPHILTPFVLSFPSLTHLDLSGTRATPDLLYALGASTTVQLRSLALARCVRLTSESIKAFLVDSPVTSQLTELNLYGDATFNSSLNAEDLMVIIQRAPCFLDGGLVYLDLSNAPLNQQILDACSPQPSLRSLGLSHITDLPIRVVAEFVRIKAVNVEVLTLVGTCPELDCGLRPGVGSVPTRGSTRQSCLTLHAALITPLCTPPLSFSLSLTPAQGKPPPTKLRVIELSTIMLGGLGVGADSWRIIRSKGGKGWYVDTSKGWVTGPNETNRGFCWNLKHDHPLRNELQKLSDANGNVSSGVGWHARKMEVLHGCGMLGREDGLYGAVSFAYQG
ncbi:leucine rich repeat domain protein [Moniliophthora roreri MCA 2997]|uniref:Leucine rich repeat domain protein n=1 Tax=Moniliophthora roreri (strain MCA 2997) TaxID=1381753 RepID=V2X5G1_MONRO|nr:leucine rich repeat domain protein [Moniliophthora roreri MCA 2997]